MKLNSEEYSRDMTMLSEVFALVEDNFAVKYKKKEDTDCSISCIQSKYKSFKVYWYVK